jgi:hypothetical protein
MSPQSRLQAPPFDILTIILLEKLVEPIDKTVQFLCKLGSILHPEPRLLEVI